MQRVQLACNAGQRSVLSASLIMKTQGNVGELKIAIRVVDPIRMTERIEG